MTITLDTIVPFGKYRGKTYGEMTKDAHYCRWLLNGLWLKGTSRDFLEEYFKVPKICKL